MTTVEPMALPGLSTSEVHDAVTTAVRRGTERMWSIDDLDWSAVRPDSLTDEDRSVVRFITFIEDHIPGYLTWLLKAFPVDGTADIDVEEFGVNREYFRFFVAWAYDEERHAATLTRYQVATGMADTDDLLRELAAEGAKHFELPYEHPLQAFTYTLVQEKATQLFYQRFMAAAHEPLLRDLLRRLARDEARHFALYSELVGAYLRRDGARAVPHLKEVLHTFQMPLANTLSGYWRWSLRASDAVGYQHTEAYEALVRLVRELVTAPGEAAVADLADFVAAIRRLP
jgi:acyl-[acyl-carrier-protein] desaturase